MKSYPVVVSCDWFSFSCSCEGGLLPEPDTEYSDSVSTSHFRMFPGVEKHPYYESSCVAREGNAPIAHLFFRCKRKENEYSCQVKVDNSRLYFARWGESLMALIRALKWHICFVNRIDVCADFNYFANGRTPLQFARDYLSLPTKSRCSFIRHSSNKLRAVVTRSLHNLNYETLSWGSRDSAVQVNLYNKSIELTDHADKPWIRQRWIEGGLLHGDVGNGKKMSVWRVEFSIKPVQLMLIEKDSKSPIGSLNLNHVYTPAALIETWNLLHPRYFCFHELSLAAHNNPMVRVRDLPLVTLFREEDCVKYAVKGVQYFRKSGRTERLLLKVLSSQFEEDTLTSEERISVRHVESLLRERFLMANARASRNNIAQDVIDDYLKTCFHTYQEQPEDAPAFAQKDLSRRARLWVRMLQSSHDPDLQEFLAQFEKLDSIIGTADYERLQRAADYVVGSALETMDCLSPNPQNTPSKTEYVCPPWIDGDPFSKPSSCDFCPF